MKKLSNALWFLIFSQSILVVFKDTSIGRLSDIAHFLHENNLDLKIVNGQISHCKAYMKLKDHQIKLHTFGEKCQ